MPIIYYVLFVVFFYFSLRQTYSGSHFTGASKGFGKFLFIIGALNELLAIAFLILLFANGLIAEAIICIVVAYMVYFIIQKIICKIKLSKYRNDLLLGTPPQVIWELYNHDMDVFVTIQAVIGLPITLGCIIYFIYLGYQ